MIIILLLPVAVAIAFIFYRRTTPELDRNQKFLLAFLRSISLFIVFLLLFNPIYYFIKKKLIKPEIIILNDVSESMQERKDQVSKTEIFSQIGAELENKFSPANYKTTFYDFADGIEGDHNSTDLSKTLKSLSKKHDLENVKSIFILSDGWFKDENLDILDQFYVPLNTFSIPFERNYFDLSIDDVKYNKTAYQDEISPISVNIAADNFKGDCRLKIMQEGKILKSQKLRFSSSEQQNIIFETDFERSGLQSFIVQVETDSTSELNKANNRFPGAILVKKEREKVLLISDVLGWDIGFINNAIDLNSRWDRKFLLKKGAYRKGRAQTNLKNEFQNIGVLILINYQKLQISQTDAELIESYVKNGGGLLLMGKPLRRLQEILPADNLKIGSSFKATFDLLDKAEKYETFRKIKNSVIPPVDHFYVKPKIQSEVLARFENEEKSTAIAFLHYEKGKVLQFAFTELWRWQLWNDENKYYEFIQDAIDWLSSRSPNRFIAYPTKNIYLLKEPVIIKLEAFDEKLNPMQNIDAGISILNEAGEKVFENYLVRKDGILQAEINDLEPGKYTFRISDEISMQKAEGSFIVSDENSEKRDVGMNIPLLSFISDRTEGRVISSQKPAEITIPKSNVQIKKIRNEIPIYKKWYVIAVFLLSFCLELFLRKRWGLL